MKLQAPEAQRVVNAFQNDTWQEKQAVVETLYMLGYLSNEEHTKLTQEYMHIKTQVHQYEEAVLFGEVLA
ncbi:hypothetical protein I2F17_08820 [Acinetobacter sp. B10A]|uniref:hypothetical protein n=1 Tax=Acinetobacter baretiae TaxID=2605383 RepID=UPI001B3C68DA|nr:hypothetical protein [Acinetobacter baretiae]MBF7685916.1 hypothetical protein [Acinetobacter baretiae]